MVFVGLISYDSIQLLTTTTDFVAFFYFTKCVVFIPPLLLVGAERLRPVCAQFCKINFILFSGV